MRLLMAAALLGGVALAGRGDDSGKNTNHDMHVSTDGPTTNGDGSTDGGPNNGETFEAFVLDQIQNHTTDTGSPVDYTKTTFAADNTDPTFFNVLFM